MADEPQRFMINGTEVAMTADDVLAATFRREPPDTANTRTWWVLIRRKRLPVRWVIVRTLDYLAQQGADVPDRRTSRYVQTEPAARILRRLGFTTGTDET
jgi:hypothetical protein